MADLNRGFLAGILLRPKIDLLRALTEEVLMNTTSQSIVAMLSAPIASRYHASEVLQKVAAAGSWGGFPDDVTCDELGQALERICLNAPVPNPLTRVLRGWQKAARRRRRRLAEASSNLDC